MEVLGENVVGGVENESAAHDSIVRVSGGVSNGPPEFKPPPNCNRDCNQNGRSAECA